MNTSVHENRQALLRQRSQRSPVVGHPPSLYHVHLNKPCNQKCIMCVPDGRHGKDLLSLEQFRSFFARIEPYAEHLTLIGGEPLLYPWIDDVLELLARHPIAVSINTNVTRLDVAMTQRLLALHELYLRCSIDAATRETYRRIRGTDVFERVTGHLRRFAESARGRPRTHLLLNYVVMRENLDEVLPFIEFARGLRPLRVEFHPVRHVRNWRVSNGTGWIFDGKEQSCESFRDEYNEVMRRAAARCAEAGLAHEVQLL
jgi:molybdenum cofactor biosynthesis enzyme MoaA